MKPGTVLVMIPNAIKAGARAVLRRRTLFFIISIVAAVTGNASALMAQVRETSGAHQPGGEANLKLPDLSQVKFVGVDGHTLLLFGLIICVLGLLFGLAIYTHLKNLPVHKSMREISELIYETCKTYLITQGKFILILEAFIAVIIAMYFGLLLKFEAVRVVVILLFSLVGIAGSYGVAWFGIRVNTFANSRTAFAGLAAKPYPLYAIPLKAGMSSAIIFQGFRLDCLEQAHIYVGWHTRGGVIFHTCRLKRFEWAHIYVVWHARSEVIFHACQLQRLEWAHIYVSWHVRSRVIFHTCRLHRS